MDTGIKGNWNGKEIVIRENSTLTTSLREKAHYMKG